jgi:hypothetical protein
MSPRRVDISVETILVAILGGLGGGLLGTWLQIRHERAEAFRERLITAADDLSTGLLQADIALRDAYSICLDKGFMNTQNQLVIHDPATGQMPTEIEDALKRAEALLGRLMPVSLGYPFSSVPPPVLSGGPDSPSTNSGTLCPHSGPGPPT